MEINLLQKFMILFFGIFTRIRSIFTGNFGSANPVFFTYKTADPGTRPWYLWLSYLKLLIALYFACCYFHYMFWAYCGFIGFLPAEYAWFIWIQSIKYPWHLLILFIQLPKWVNWFIKNHRTWLVRWRDWLLRIFTVAFDRLGKGKWLLEIGEKLVWKYEETHNATKPTRSES